MEKPSPDVARKSSAEIRSEVEKIAVPYSLLEKITEDFSIERRVGQGGFATVYFASIYLAGNAAPRHQGQTQPGPQGTPRGAGLGSNLPRQTTQAMEVDAGADRPQ